jgi:N-acetylglutamate synthase-like GNAT family acetyltransferase
LKNFEFFNVRHAGVADLAWVHSRLKEAWGGTVMAVHGEAIDMIELPTLVAGGGRGFLIYRVWGLAAEIVAMEAVEIRRGVGTAMLAALVGKMEGIGVQEIWVTTTRAFSR